MAAIRRNIVESPTDAQRFVDGVLALKATNAGVRASQLGIGAGPRADDVDLSWWDLFVVWHAWSMRQMTGGGRNAAHSGPVFLPWHRWFMLMLEIQMRNLMGLGPDDFGLPYWDWSGDGDLPAALQTQAPVFTIVGGDGFGNDGDLATGPFVPNNGFVVNIEEDQNNNLRVTNRPIRRDLGVFTDRLPDSGDIASTMALGVYDTEPFSADSRGSFRNSLEGWSGDGHNQVHVFVGGDMLAGTSPNDPIFFLNHCNVDRLWAQWQAASPANIYVPTGTSAADDVLFRHRSNDPLYSILTQVQPAVSAMDDVDRFYAYDSLIV